MIKQFKIYGILVGLTIVLTLLFSFWVKSCNDPPPEPPEIIYVPEKVIVDRIVQSETSGVLPEEMKEILGDLLGDNLDEIQDHLNSLDMNIAAINQIEIRGTGTRIIERVVTEEGTITPIDRVLSVTFPIDGEEQGVDVPVAEVHVTSEGLLDTLTYDLGFQIDTIITQTDLHSISAINFVSLQSGLQTFDLPISSTTEYVLQVQDHPIPRRSRFQLYDPTLDLNLEYRGEMAGSIGVSLSTLERYGDELLRFFRPGIGYDGYEAYFTFSPAMYNIGRPLPLFENLWIAPGVGIDVNGDITYSIGIGATL